MPQPEKYDSGDLDAVAELERSRGYGLLLGKINAELQRKRDYLEQAQDDPVRFTQGYIAGLRMVAQLPGILKGEIKAQL